MDFDVRDLELIEAIGRHETLTAAAAHLYVSQPALSQRLTKLEARLGTPLFDRRGRLLVANRAGRRTLQVAQRVLADLRAAERDVRAIRDGRLQPVRVASQCTTNYTWLSPILGAFRDRLPGADVRIDGPAGDDPIQGLLTERLDVALVTKLEPEMDRVRLQRLFDDELVTLVAPGHPWAALEAVEPAAFADAELILFESYDPGRTPAVPLPIPPGATPGCLSTPPVNTDVLVELVAGGSSVTVLPSWIAAPYLDTGRLVPVPLSSGALLRTWYVATRHGERPEPIDVFVDVLADHLTPGSPRALLAEA